MSIIAISGKMGSGKDTVASIIRYLTSECSLENTTHYRTYLEFTTNGKDDNYFQGWYNSDWEIKRFAGKLKYIASLLTGIPESKFEDQEFKKTFLGEEWDTTRHYHENGIPGIFQMTVREFLQKLGTDAIRDNIHTNTWVNALFADYVGDLELVPNPNGNNAFKVENVGEFPNWLITDCRFPNEAESIKQRQGIIIRVNRPKKKVEAENHLIEKILNETKDFGLVEHPSETALDDYNFDYVINNNGSIDDLIVKVKFILTLENIIPQKQAA